MARCIRCSAIFSPQDEEEIIPNRLLVNSAASLLWICAVVVAIDVNKSVLSLGRRRFLSGNVFIMNRSKNHLIALQLTFRNEELKC